MIPEYDLVSIINNHLIILNIIKKHNIPEKHSNLHELFEKNVLENYEIFIKDHMKKGFDYSEINKFCQEITKKLPKEEKYLNLKNSINDISQKIILKHTGSNSGQIHILSKWEDPNI